jgi:hypothetical protein
MDARSLSGLISIEIAKTADSKIPEHEEYKVTHLPLPV